MGRIKTQQVKSKTNEILSEYGEEFTANFDENKKKLDELMDIPSKKIRNVIAGFITRLKKKSS